MQNARELQQQHFVVLGAGPAGIGAAWELVQRGATNVSVIDRNDRPGGLARTYTFHGYRFDVGPHRFMTKYPEVAALWKRILGGDLLTRPRLARIYYQGRFFHYPLKFSNVLWNLGFWQSLLAGLSLVRARIAWRGRQPKNFAEWTTKTFGDRMSNAFFRNYFKKVWGIEAKDVGIEWAQQRIRQIRLWDFFGKKLREFVWQQRIENIGNTFYYPRYGAGTFYEKMQTELESAGVQFHFGREITGIQHDESDRVTSVTALSNGGVETYQGDFFISSIPTNYFIGDLVPAAPPAILEKLNAMRFRAHVAVNAIIDRESLFPDSWLYIQSPQFRIARIGNYSAFSPDMLGRPRTSAIGVEFYCFADDDFWKQPDDEVIELAVRELVALRFIKREEFVRAFVTRHRDAYPTYYLGYQEAFLHLRNFLEKFTNLSLIGRAGMYKYKDQDHALYTGMLAVRNIFGERHDVWGLGEEQEHFEEQIKVKS